MGSGVFFDFVRNFPLFSILGALFCGVLCFLLRGRMARRVSVALEVILIVMSLLVLIRTWQRGSFTYVMGEFPAPWGNEIRAGVLEALLGLVFLSVILCSVCAGYRFVDVDLDESKVNLYYALLNLLTASVMAILWTNDIFTGYVFLEILTLSSCGILICREIGRTTLAAVRYMILNLMGSGLYLLGVILLYDVTGHLLMVPMRETIASMAQDPAYRMTLTFALGILTIGLSIKSGLFPFHFWMPDTYGMATPASGSVMSAVVSKTYIFLLIKVYYRAVGIELFRQMPLANVLLVLGVLGMIFGSFGALRQNNVNRMTAFSSAAQIGYIYMGIGLGKEAGFVAALFHVLAHCVTKSMLFLTTPRLAEVSASSMKFKMLTGSARRDRDAGAFFLIASLSMIGIPVFAGFSSKLFFSLAAVRSTGYIRMGLVLAALAASSLLNAMYFMRTVIRIYSVRGLDPNTMKIRAHHRAGYNIPMAVLAAANLFLGLFSWIAVDLITRGLHMLA